MQSLTGAAQADAGAARTPKRPTPEQLARYRAAHNARRLERRAQRAIAKMNRPCSLCGDPIGVADLRLTQCRECSTWIATYMPVDYALSCMRARMLRALRWLDWVESRELFIEVMGLDEDFAAPERKAAQTCIKRLVASGLVERRSYAGRRHHLDYRITEAGRRVADQVRFGVHVMRAA
jgi:hypothetical protein